MRRFRSLLLVIGFILFTCCHAAGSGGTYNFQWSLPLDVWGHPNGIAIDSSGNFYTTDLVTRTVSKYSSTGSLIRTWGSQGYGNGQFIYPQGVAINNSGYIFIVDSGTNRVQVFGSNGDFFSSWSPSGSGFNALNSPRGIACDVNDNIYITDFDHRVLKFSSDGIYLTQWGSYGSGTGQFQYPTGIAAGDDGYIYVIDWYNSRVQKFDTAGIYITQWGSQGVGAGQFSSPSWIAINPDGKVFVDDNTNRIQVFTSDGTFLTQWSAGNAGAQEFKWPAGIAADTSGNILLADSGNYRVIKYTVDGTYITQWGSGGTGNGQFFWPQDITITKSGYFYVIDTYNSRVQRFALDGTYVSQWGSYGTGNTQFIIARSITSDSENNIYVADSNKIKKFSSEGAYISQWGSAGSGDGQFQYPYDVTTDTIGNIYVADTSNHRIQKFSSDGTFITKWGTQGSGDGQFSNPHGVAVAENGNVFVVDGNSRVQVFTPDGTFLTKWGSGGSENGQFFNPSDISFDSEGNILITDWYNRVQKFSSDGTYLTQWGTGGTGNGEFNCPDGIAVDENGNVYIADTRNGRIQKFQYTAGSSSATIADFSATPTSGTTPLTVQFTDLSTGSPISWIWSFGDGDATNATQQNPVHTYKNAGIFTVTLTASNATGSDTETKMNYIIGYSSAFNITNVNPKYATNIGKTTVEITGSGFQNGATIALKKTGYPTITGSEISVIPPGKIIASFDLNGASMGSWDVSVTNPEGTTAVFNKGFVITAVPQTKPILDPQPVKMTINTGKSDKWVDPQGDKTNAKIVYEISPSDFSGELTTEIYDNDSNLVSPENYHAHSVSGGTGEVFWDGKIEGVKVNEANNPYIVKLVLKNNGKVVTEPYYQKIWVGRPVLIVHGMWDSKNEVETKKLISELKTDHYVWVVEYNHLAGIGKVENIFGNIVDYSKTLNEDILFIRGLTKAGKVDIVAHSMGGLISRYRVEKQTNGRDDVGKLIMIGTPNHGSELATAPDFILSKIIFGPVLPTIKQKIKEKAQENVAIYEMMPHSIFLQKLNGNNACDYYIDQGGEIDSITDKTGYYVIASNFNRFPTLTHLHLDIFGKYGKEIPSLTWEGDGAVTYNSAKISDVTTFPVPDAFHTGQFNNDDVISAVKLKLQMPDTVVLPGSSMNSKLLHSFDQASSDQNGHLPIFWTTPIITQITDGNTQNFSINIENASTSCIFTTSWDSGDMNIAFIAPNNTVTYQTATNDTLWYTVESPESGYWIVSVLPTNIPAAGVNLSIQSIQANPLYLVITSNETAIRNSQSHHISAYVGTDSIPAMNSSVSATITKPDRTISQIVLFDDGLHDDALADDGIFGNSYTDTGLSGIYIIDITANGTFLENTFERTNSYFLSVQQMPDLSISPTDVQVSNITPEAGEYVNITAIVKNTGEGDASNATILYSDTINNSTTIFAEQVVTLNHDTQQEVTASWKAKTGSHILNIAVSPYNTFYETDYSNDNVSVIITVPEPVMNIRAANLTLCPGQSGDFSIYATNLTDIGSVSVAYYFNGTVINVDNVSSDTVNLTSQLISSDSVVFNGTLKVNVSGNTCLGTIHVNASDSATKGSFSTLIVELFNSDDNLVVQEIIPGTISIDSEITPAVNFNGSPVSGEVPLIVQFTDLSTGSPDSWNWSFGDGNFSETQNLNYTYSSIGSYTVSLTATNTYGSNTTAKSNYITVTAPATLPSPKISSVTPVSGYLNSTISFTITGANYQTGDSKTMVNYTKGSFINNNITLTSVTTTKIEGTMTVGPDAPAGPWDLTVTTANGGTSLKKTGALAVSPVAAPVIASISPTKGAKNTTVNITVAGSNFQTGSGQTRMRIYEDVMDTELEATPVRITPFAIYGTVTIPGEALSGTYILEINCVDGGTATKAGAFIVAYSDIPTITSISPTSGFMNDSVRYAIIGTNFEPGLTTVIFRNQTTNTVLGTSEVSDVTTTRITGNVTIPAAAPAGFYRADVITTDGGSASRINAIRVEAIKPPVIGSLTPSTGAKGSVTAFTLTGSNFMTAEKTAVRIVDDVSGTEPATTLFSVTPTKIIGSFTIPASAPSGKYRLIVSTTDGGEVTRREAFTVSYLGLPVIGTLTPATGARNSNVAFTLNGDNFVDGRTIVRMRAFGSTINATALSVNTTKITGEFPVPAGATTGAYRLDVITTGGGFNSKMNAFTVTAA